ncbi:dethiobiotin synthase [Veillonella criceti]|uniref:ATP-dependent dethiobiotin synthetase BioD n=1 Tax=Veillonella criceti TaxID=103891 RepID=A0A380NLT8_9FIRM|nr:dethiobiotin synthase [Veillonella criceti]SUP44252.1 ATP-dependent dethiobiotin synthetase BioD 1 [Veillonella criceti]
MAQEVQSKGLFVVGTGTDVGKTYITGLLVKALREGGYKAGYYKAAVSGAPSIADSDAGYVNKVANMGAPEDTLLSYLYDHAVSPHLAAQWEGNPVEQSVVTAAFEAAKERYEYVTMEGSGGIMCPLRYDEIDQIFLEDVIQWFHLPTVLVAHAGLGTINATVLTIEYLRARQIPVKGVILNYYTNSPMEQDNKKMIETLTGVPVIACVPEGASDLGVSADSLATLYDEV